MDNQTNQLGEYRILQLLGEGQYTKVFLGQKASEHYAIKVFSGPYLTDSSFQKRLAREFRITHRIQHPNLVRYYEMGQYNKHPFIVMEYLGQATLQRLLAHHKRAPASVAVSITLDVLQGLAFLHSNRIIHRDIKPSAVFLTQAGRVVLADFDIAKPFDDTSLTIKGTIIGSPRYMAPEQRLGQNATILSDIFSTGVTLYEMLTGEAPWKDINHLPTDRRSWASIVPPSRLFQDVTPELDKIVLTAIDLQPGRRFGSADEMANALKKMRHAPQSDLVAWASGRKSNVNLSFSETEQEKRSVKRELPEKRTRIKVQPKKTTRIPSVLWWSGAIGLLICMIVSAIFLWRTFNTDNVFFQDDFSDSQASASQWSPSSGEWEIANGMYYCSTSDKKCLSFINAIPEGNFTLSVDVYGQDGIDKSIYFGAKNKDYYRLSFRSDPVNEVILSELHNESSEKILLQKSWQIGNQTWYKIQLIFNDQTLSLSINGVSFDSIPNPIYQQTGGKLGVGIEAISNGASTVNSAAFDNVEITIEK